MKPDYLSPDWIFDGKEVCRYHRLEILNLSTRAQNLLLKPMVHFEQVWDFSHVSENFLLRLPGCGRRTLNEIKEIMNRAGVSFAVEQIQRKSS